MDRTNVSGAAMDRVIPRSRHTLRNAVLAATVVAAGVAIYFVTRPGGGRASTVAGDRVVIGDVVRGEFDDFIQVRATATPARTTFLDTAQGGQVESIHVEDGQVVERGQLLVVLSNTQLQLDVIAREAQIMEQLNNLRTLELAHEQNRLAHRREIVEAEYQITRLTRQLAQDQQLVASGASSKSSAEDLRDELAYQKRRREVQLESFAAADKLQKAQLVQLRLAATQLEKNLEVTRKNLDGLNVRASAPGQLTAFTLEVGQSLPPGERIGQIDDPQRFKLTADVDEYYLSRVAVGQKAEVDVDGKRFPLKVQKIRPQVQDSRFQADLVFEGDPPAIRRGQTAQVRLQLGQPTEATLVPNAAFYHDTGGAWVFVVSGDQRHAVRRNVRLGRRNPQQIEVLEGLEPGERIVTSSYTSFLDSQRLELAP